MPSDVEISFTVRLVWYKRRLARRIISCLMYLLVLDPVMLLTTLFRCAVDMCSLPA